MQQGRVTDRQHCLNEVADLEVRSLTCKERIKERICDLLRSKALPYADCRSSYVMMHEEPMKWNRRYVAIVPGARYWEWKTLQAWVLWGLG